MNTRTMEGQHIKELPLAFFDLETTGLSAAQGHRICEIALLRVRDGSIEQRYTTLINPRRPVEPQAFAVNGISPSMVQDAPTFETVIDSLLDILHGTVIVAHNAPFDISFLACELTRAGRTTPINPVIDTLVLSRQLLPARPSHSLHALSTDLRLHTPDHRAMSDVLALRGLFDHLLVLMDELQVRTLGEVLRYQRGLLPGEPELVAPPLIAQALKEKRQLRIIYNSVSTPIAHERIIEPLELAKIRGKLYLRAYCHLRKDNRSFALDKIESMEFADMSFQA